MSLIDCKDVSFSYDGNIVLSAVNFRLNLGDYLCVVGENGSGKSTLVKGLLRLKSPASGQINFSDGLSSSHTGYLPQQSAVQRDFPATVFEVVLSGRLNSRRGRPFYSKIDKQEAIKKLCDVKMSKWKKHSYQELSGGQQQRVLLARALCATKKLILLDEPVSGLDPVVTNQMYSLIQEINKKSGITVIMVSHDLNAINYATHILHLGSTQLFFGKKEEYIETPLGKRFIGENEYV